MVGLGVCGERRDVWLLGRRWVGGWVGCVPVGAGGGETPRRGGEEEEEEAEGAEEEEAGGWLDGAPHPPASPLGGEDMLRLWRVWRLCGIWVGVGVLVCAWWVGG